jgi:citrate lyase subunit beta / citryl-CoA lyase
MKTPFALASARSFLFVPGNRPARFEKALRSGADAVVLDLEDSVPVGEKVMAREAIATAWPALQAMGVPVVVRINVVEQGFGQEDLRWIARLHGLSGIMVPKVESATSLAAVRLAMPEVPVLPLIESAAGYLALQDIAGAQGVVRLVVGHIDFMADTGLQCSEGEPELTPLRFAVAMTTRQHGLAPAVDGVTTSIEDNSLLREDTRRAMRFGFGAKLCIHPRQVALVHGVLAPTEAEVAWARRVVEADATSGGAAVQLDGRMVDLPVVLQARRVLSRIPA